MPDIALRAASIDDSGDLLAWRNDPATRQASQNTAAVSLADHTAWLAESLANPRRKLLIAMDCGQAVGVVRFDTLFDPLDGEPARYLISIAVSPAARGRGVGKAILSAACHIIAPATVDAWIRTENDASKAMFVACGFRWIGRAPEDGLNLYRATVPA